LVIDIPAGDGKIGNFFIVYVLLEINYFYPSMAFLDDDWPKLIFFMRKGQNIKV
jgi:hypothetical protein